MAVGTVGATPATMAGFLAPDGSVVFGHGGVMGQVLKITKYDYEVGSLGQLNRSRGKEVPETWTVTGVSSTATAWEIQRPSGTEPMEFNRLFSQDYMSDGFHLKPGVKRSIDLLTLTYPSRPIKVGETWLVHNPSKNVDITVTLKSVSDLQGRLVANVEFDVPVFSSNPGLTHAVGAIDIVTGLVVQAKGELSVVDKATGKFHSYVYDREFHGTE